MRKTVPGRLLGVNAERARMRSTSCTVFKGLEKIRSTPAVSSGMAGALMGKRPARGKKQLARISG